MGVQFTHKSNGNFCPNLSKSSLKTPGAILREGEDLNSDNPASIELPEYLSHISFKESSSTIFLPRIETYLAQTDSRQNIEDESAEEVANSIQQPKPLSSKRPYTSFLDDSVDQTSSSTAPKRYRPESVDKFVTQWVESVSESETYREIHCRSDSLLNKSGGDLNPSRRSKSVPSMANDRDVFKKPTTPASATARSMDPSVTPSDAASSADVTSPSSGSKRKVAQPAYRDLNLAFNNIHKRGRSEKFPEHIRSLIDYVQRDHDFPGPTPEAIWEDKDLENLTNGVAEGRVEDYFKNRIFYPLAGPAALSVRLPLTKDAVPNIHPKYKISIPVPDLLYGYGREQILQLQTMVDDLFANTELLMFPFFDIEFKGAGTLWVATNQCLGGSVSCVNLAERINDRLRQYKSNGIKPINSAVFSVAMSASEARLHVSWKQDERIYYLQEVRSFLLQMPNDHLQFRKYVRNIIDWGNGRRLDEVRELLNKLRLLEGSRKRVSEVVKSPASPSNDDSASTDSRKRRAIG